MSAALHTRLSARTHGGSPGVTRTDNPSMDTSTPCHESNHALVGEPKRVRAVRASTELGGIVGLYPELMRQGSEQEFAGQEGGLLK